MPSCCINAIVVAVCLGGLTCLPAPAAASPPGVRITDLRLAFDDGQPRKIVPRRQQGLQAYADLAYTGSGMIEGFWVVDGRVVADLTQYVGGAGHVRIASPATPGLPAVETGLHVITLVVKSPAGPLPPVSLSYFVTTNIKATGLPIALVAPPDESRLDPDAATFTWEANPAVKTYLIEIIDDDPGRPVMSAFTEDERYQVPVPVARHRFRPGTTYYWRIKGFSADHHLVSESFPYQFQTAEDQETAAETDR